MKRASKYPKGCMLARFEFLFRFKIVLKWTSLYLSEMVSGVHYKTLLFSEWNLPSWNVGKMGGRRWCSSFHLRMVSFRFLSCKLKLWCYIGLLRSVRLDHQSTDALIGLHQLSALQIQSFALVVSSFAFAPEYKYSWSNTTEMSVWFSVFRTWGSGRFGRQNILPLIWQAVCSSDTWIVAQNILCGACSLIDDGLTAPVNRDVQFLLDGWAHRWYVSIHLSRQGQ